SPLIIFSRRRSTTTEERDCRGIGADFFPGAMPIPECADSGEYFRWAFGIRGGPDHLCFAGGRDAGAARHSLARLAFALPLENLRANQEPIIILHNACLVNSPSTMRQIPIGFPFFSSGGRALSGIS